MKKLVSLILCVSLLVCAVPAISATAEANELSYTFANDFIANANGVISYSGELGADAAVKLYWADGSGTALEGYRPFAETDGGTLTSGYSIDDNLLIPAGAKVVLAEITSSDAVSTYTVAIPEEKQNSGDDIYTMFFVSDSHFNADEYNNKNMDKASMIIRFTALKDLMDELAQSGDNLIGSALIGDVVVGKQTSSDGHGVWEAFEEDYILANEVLSETEFEAAYPMWYINGNHDIIYSENGDGSAWINFLDQKIADLNTAVENEIYPENIMSAINKVEKENGKYWYDTYIGGYHYIFLAVPYGGFVISDDQLEWLDSLLSEDAKSGRPTFVIGHYPMSYTHEASAGHFDNSADLEAVLAKYPNTVYVSGHTHISPEVNTKNVIIGNNETTKINTGALISTLTDADGNKIYTPNGIYCKVYEDRIEFHARVFCNLNDGTDGYWVSGTSKVLNLRNSAGSDISAEISADSDAIRNGTRLTALVDGKAADSELYECRWYVDNTYVGSGATHTLSYYADEDKAIVTPSGKVSVSVKRLSDNSTTWCYLDTLAEIFIEISSGEELARIGANADYPLDGKYILTGNIDLSSFENWTPIGNDYSLLDASAFSGVLEGNGYTVSNMSVTATEVTNGLAQVYGGLFNHIMGAQIRNLVIKDATVVVDAAGKQVFGGAIAANAEATASGTPCTISNVAVINSTVTVKNTNKVFGAGAFIGSVNKRYTTRRNGGVSFENCYSNAGITASFAGEQACAGGFVGYFYNAKKPCEFSDCIFDGTISGIDDQSNPTRMSGLVGRSLYNNVVISHAYSNSDKYVEYTAVEGEYPIYPISGTKLTSKELSAATVQSLGLSDKWIDSDIGPVLSIAEFGIFYADYIPISSGEELAKIGVNSGYPLDSRYMLTNDIDLSSFESWTPIGDINNTDDRTAAAPNVFWGTLDGNGHKIKNLTINWTTGTEAGKGQIYVGLFAATRGATVKNIIFENTNITVSNSKDQNMAGIVAGGAEASNSGVPSTFSNIHINGAKLTIGASYNVAAIGSFAGSVNKRSTSNTVGGLVLKDCYSNAEIVNTKSGGQSCAGGFAGYAYATKSTGLEFSDSIFEGTITCTGATHWSGSVIGRALGPNAAKPTYYTVTNVYTSAGIENTATDGTNISVASSGDYDNTADLDTLKFSDKYWYNTPVGARHRIALVRGDIDASGEFDARDAAYITKYLLSGGENTDSAAADINNDGKNDILDLIKLKKLIAGAK